MIAGPSPHHDLRMACKPHMDGRLEANRIVVDRGSGRTLELNLSADGQRVEATHRTATSTTAATFTQSGSNGK